MISRLLYRLFKKIFKSVFRANVATLLHAPAISPANVLGMMQGDRCMPLISAWLKITGKTYVATALTFLT